MRATGPHPGKGYRRNQAKPGKEISGPSTAEKNSSRSALIVALIVALIGGAATVLAAVINHRSNSTPFISPQVVFGGPPTAGQTTHEYVYHAAGNLAGEAWFNSGEANMGKGRNSFTVKDLYCGDSWGIQVQYWFYNANGKYVQGNIRLPSDCSPEESRSIPGGSNALPTTLTFHWRAGKYDNHGWSGDTWEPWITTTIS